MIADLETRPIDRARFLSEVDSIARDLPRPASPAQAGSIRFATIAESEGVRARVVFATNLAEGTFPSRGAVAGQAADEGGVPIAYARERLAMLRLIGSTDELVLLVPTSDEQGRERLAAGFVDDDSSQAGTRRRAAGFRGRPAA